MGSTYVTLTRGGTGDDPGFWMRDEWLELWLRLIALHLPEPNDAGEHQATPEIRNQWLLASLGFFVGCVPHGLEDACASEEGEAVVRHAILSLLHVLEESDTPLDPDTFNLMGFQVIGFTSSVERRCLKDIGHAFLDLLDGKIVGRASRADILPGSKPYQRVDDT